MRVLLLTGLATLGVLAAPAAIAQSVDNSCGFDGAEAVVAGDRTTSEVNTVEAAPLGSAFSVRNALQITAKKDTSTVSFRMGHDFGPTFQCANGRQKSRSSALTFTVSSPLSEGATEAKFADLDSLANGTSLEVSFRSLTIHSAEDIDDLAMEEICDRARRAYGARPGRDPVLAAKSGCTKTLVRKWDPRAVRDFDKAAWGKGAYVSAWSVTGRVGYQSFDYLDTATLAKLNDEKTSWSIGAAAGVQPIGRGSLFAIGYRRESGWEAQKEVILCPAGGGVVTCVKGAGGAPKQTEKDVISLEYRQQAASFAFSTKLAYDARDSATGVEIPLYLTPDKDGSLIGGVKLGWRSDTEEVTAAVFIGAPFSLGLP